MWLEEDKQGGLRRIGRRPEAERQPGPLLENTLRKLHTGHGLNNRPLAERAPCGDTLEAQLVRYPCMKLTGMGNAKCHFLPAIGVVKEWQKWERPPKKQLLKHQTSAFRA